MIGLHPIGTIAFGFVLVHGKKRLAKPASVIMAVVGRLNLLIFIPPIAVLPWIVLLHGFSHHTMFRLIRCRDPQAASYS